MIGLQFADGFRDFDMWILEGTEVPPLYRIAIKNREVKHPPRKGNGHGKKENSRKVIKK